MTSPALGAVRPLSTSGYSPGGPTSTLGTVPSLPFQHALTGFEKALSARRLQRAKAGGTTVAQAFNALFGELEITEAEQKKASRQQQALRAQLNGLLAILDDYLSGSYRRHTLIRPLDDIDLLVVLDALVYAQIALDAAGAIAVLDELEDAIRTLYPNTEVKRHDRCVQILFSGTGIGFDVVPAFRLTDDEFWIPDTRRGGWLKTNPREVQRLVSEANRGRCDGWLVPLVKALKAWKDTVGAPLSGFHLEAMAYHALTRAPANEREGLAFLFDALATDVLFTTPDIWPYGEAASAYLSAADRQTAHALLSSAARDAADAVTAEVDGRTQDAHRLWFGLLGERYPEPGIVRTVAVPASGLAAVQAIRTGAYVSAASTGVMGRTPGYAGGRSSTSHGGAMDLVADSADLTDAGPDGHSSSATRMVTAAQRDRLEREIATTLAQFTALRRLTPGDAAADAALWPVRPGREHRLYTVLVGEQRSNVTGRWHRILVTVPNDAPATEARVYALDQHVRHQPVGGGRWAPARPRRHQWADGAMCTHALRDRWDGRLVTLLVFAADWLVRHDYYQLTGRWIGREIGPTGLLVNGRAPGAPARSRGRARTSK